MGFLLFLCQKMVGIILKYFDLGALRRCEKNHKVLNFSSDYIKKSIHIKSMEQVKWNTKGKWGKTHLQAEDDSGIACNQIFYADGVQDPKGTPVAEPPKLPASGSIITVGGSTDNKLRRYQVWFN